MKSNLHVYTGEGKGKTTAAMGLALRSLGHGNKVLIAQFMKNGISGELSALKQFPNATVLCAPVVRGFISKMSSEDRERTRREQCAFAIEVKRIIEDARPNTIVLDELNAALWLGMIDDETARSLIETALKHGETVSTGRNAPEWLIDRADYVSVISARKHPYISRKQPARKGVEW